MQFRITNYSIKEGSFERSRTINLNPTNQSTIEELSGGYYASRFVFRDDSTFLAGFRTVYSPDPTSPVYEEERYIKFYRMDMNGRILPGKIFEQRASERLTATVKGEIRSIGASFMEKSLITVSMDGYIYSASSNDFLIEVRNPDGEYLRAFYYPIEKRIFTREGALRSTEKRLEGMWIGAEEAEQILERWTSIIQHAAE